MIGAFLLVHSVSAAVGADTNPPPAAKVEDTNVTEVQRSYLHLQEQLLATQLALEQTRKESKESSAQTAATLTARLQAIEQALNSQRALELEAMQRSNLTLVLVGGSFAALGFVALVLMAYFQWRTVHGLAEVTASLPGARPLEPAPVLALGAGEAHLVTAGMAEQSNQRLLGVLERLEKRICELEHSTHLPLKAGVLAAGEAPNAAAAQANGHSEPSSEAAGAAPAPNPGTPVAAAGTELSVLLRKAQTLLDQDSPEAALSCLDEALALDGNHSEALVKKGAALERLQKLDEALKCYDQAIAADSSMTIAYLHKGGLFNRLERFSEALACYEQALHTQEKRAA